MGALPGSFRSLVKDHTSIRETWGFLPASSLPQVIHDVLQVHSKCWISLVYLHSHQMSASVKFSFAHWSHGLRATVRYHLVKKEREGERERERERETDRQTERDREWERQGVTWPKLVGMELMGQGRTKTFRVDDKMYSAKAHWNWDH